MPPYVKTSLAPGSKVVTEYLDAGGPDAGPREARLPRRRLRLHDLHRQQRAAARRRRARRSTDGKLVAAAVLSGNRNFEGRVNPDVKANYLASPPLVVAYALAGTTDIDLANEPLGTGRDGEPRLPRGHLADAGGGRATLEAQHRRARCSRRPTPTSSTATRRGTRSTVAGGRPLRLPRGLDLHPGAAVLPGAHPGRCRRSRDIEGARVLALLGDSVTTDHISPAGDIAEASPAGQLPEVEHGVAADGLQLLRLAPRQRPRDDARHLRQHPPQEPAGARRRGRRHRPRARPASRWRSTTRPSGTSAEGTPLVVLAGKEYGSGSLARLGGQGHAAPRRARGHRRELRAHPPQQPGRHGRPAAAVQGRARTPRRSASRARRRSTIVGLAGELGAAPGRDRRHGARRTAAAPRSW